MADIPPQRLKAFDIGAELAKQLITVATAMIAFLVVFSKDFAGTVSSEAKIFAYIAWFLYFTSIICGILVLGALTAQLEPLKPQGKGAASPNEPTTRGAAATYSRFQIVTFGLALFSTIFYGIAAQSISLVIRTLAILTIVIVIIIMIVDIIRKHRADSS
jgi:hypothetical protein